MSFRLQAAILAVTVTAFTVTTLAADTNPAHDSPVADRAEIHEINQEFEQAIGAYKHRVEIIEEKSGPYAEELIDPLIGLARNHLAVGDYDASINASERAMHISHRNDGVYSLRQLEALDLLTEVSLSMGNPRQADTTQGFALFVAEHNVGKDSPELLPSLGRMSNWFVETGQLNRANKVLARSENILELNDSDDDPLHLPILLSRAKVKRLLRSKSYKVLEEALGILDANPAIPDEQRSQVFVELADAYSTAGKRKDADHFYQLAWSTMNENQRRENFSRPREIALSKVLHDRERLNAAIFVPTSDYLGRVRLEELKPQDRLIEESMKPQEFFLPQLSKDYKFRLKDRGDSFERQRVTRVIGYPIQFVYAQLMHILPVHLRRNDGLAQLGIELNFTVGTNGRISDIKINSENSPRNLVRLMKKVLRQVTYRPRMINGKPVETSNVKIYQTFEP